MAASHGKYDTVVLGGIAVVPGHGSVRADLAIKDGRIAGIGAFDSKDAAEVVDASDRVVLPGAVDAHCHLGIYNDLGEDVHSETRSAVAGGATTVLSYFRTGQHYLNKTGPYKEIFPEVLNVTAGNAWCDVGYHLAPMTAEQVAEVPALVADQGVASFKYYMFYKGMNLAGDQRSEGGAHDYTMSDVYDLGHLYGIMEQVTAANDAHTDRRVSLSIHAEQPELIRIFAERARGRGFANPLEEYSEARPPLTERLAVAEAGVLASSTSCPVNFLHLSSAEALDAALKVRRENPGLDVRAETTLHHLALTYERYSDQCAKVNPPIRSERDLERLWDGVLAGDIDWIVSDHACCQQAHKEGELWRALPGFGGTALLYPFLLTEGTRRGLPLHRIVELVSTGPAKAYGLAPRKGALAVGADADLAIVDTDTEATVEPELLLSAQEYTPFAGMSLTGWPVRTLVRGRTVYADGDVVADPAGVYLPRPSGPAGV